MQLAQHEFPFGSNSLIHPDFMFLLAIFLEERESTSCESYICPSNRVFCKLKSSSRPCHEGFAVINEMWWFLCWLAGSFSSQQTAINGLSIRSYSVFNVSHLSERAGQRKNTLAPINEQLLSKRRAVHFPQQSALEKTLFSSNNGMSQLTESTWILLGFDMLTCSNTAQWPSNSTAELSSKEHECSDGISCLSAL